MTISKTSILVAGFLAATGGLSALPQVASAQAISCGGSYTVRPGDSLSAIAQRAYGDPKTFQFLFSANSSVIGENPGIIKVDAVLDIPCLDNQTASTAPVISTETGVERLPFPNARQIRVLTGSDWAPFTNEDQEQGGMLVEMVNVALSNSETKPDYKIDFVNDWGAHLSPLLTDHAYDLSIAWYEPDCDVISRLGEDSQFRCNNFDWSEPIYEQIMGYYVRASDPAPSSYEDIANLQICRPAGYSTFFLEADNLTSNLSQPQSPADCISGLHNGTYDVVVLAPEVAELPMSELGVTDKTLYVEALAKVLPIGAVISKNHPQGAEILSEFDSALRELKQSGEWFQIVLRHLREHKANTQ